MGRATREKWAELVARWARSGLTAKRFAARAGINAGTLQYYKWKWQLGRDGRVSSTKDSGLKPAVGFVELRARDLAAPEDATAGGRIEVVLGGGIRVFVSAGFDAGAFRKVVDALEIER